MNTSKKVTLLENHQNGGFNIPPAVTWNVLVTLIQLELPVTKQEFAAFFQFLAPKIAETTRFDVNPEDFLKELKAKHVLKCPKKKSNVPSENYESVDLGKLKWDLKQIKTLLNYDGVMVRKNEKAVCILCESDCRSGHNFCEHLRGKVHCQRIVEIWNDLKMSQGRTWKCSVCESDVGTQSWEIEAHLRSGLHRSKLLHFIGMPYCELCGVYMKFGMKAHASLAEHQEKVRSQGRQRYENGYKKFIPGILLSRQPNITSFNIVNDNNDGSCAQVVRVTDPCRGGLTLRATTNVVCEVVMEVENCGDTNVEILDCLLDSDQARLFGLVAAGKKPPMALQPKEIVQVAIRLLCSDPAFVLCKFTVRTPAKDYVRELRYLCLNPIRLDELEQESKKIPAQSVVFSHPESADDSRTSNEISNHDDELLSRLKINWDI